MHAGVSPHGPRQLKIRIVVPPTSPPLAHTLWQSASSRHHVSVVLPRLSSMEAPAAVRASAMALHSLLEQGSYLEASLLVKATIRVLLPREDGEPLAPALDDHEGGEGGVSGRLG